MNDARALRATRAALVRDLNEALPAVLAMAVFLAASVVLDGWPLVVIVGLAVVGMFAGFAYRDRSSRGVERRRAREQFETTLDRTESRARAASRVAPVVAALIVAGLTGFDAIAFAVASLGGFFLAQALFGVWLYVRRSV
jgi:general stress protein CsbA